MDSKSELRIITEALMQVLDHKRSMLEDKHNPKDLPHDKIIDGLLTALNTLPQKNQTTSVVNSHPEIEVVPNNINNILNNPDRPWDTHEEEKSHIQNTIVSSKVDNSLLNSTIGANTPVQQSKSTPTGEVNPETIDSFADYMGEDSLIEPIINPVRK